MHEKQKGTRQESVQGCIHVNQPGTSKESMQEKQQGSVLEGMQEKQQGTWQESVKESSWELGKKVYKKVTRNQEKKYA